jgi:1-aminocyclopropane-1-carboxylate deaminase
MFFEAKPTIPNQFVTQINGFSITIKREDLIHPEVSGNKFRKLKYNLEEARSNKATALVTFGGAFSNHLAATAAAGDQLKIKTHGFVRGEELEFKERNPTLKFCESKGMQLHFISRSAYRQKEQADAFKVFLKQHPSAYVLPEGGTNELAIQGCKEILTPEDDTFSTICCSVGTGGTFSGLIQASSNQEVLGFVVVKDPEIEKTVQSFAAADKVWELLYDYDCGGYGVFSPELITFINNFHEKHKILLDPVYTGKMVFGIFTLIKKKQWRWGKNILIIHTGGIQGIQGANWLLEQQGREIIRC